MMRTFEGQTVVVTGAAGGLGRAIARRFARLGGHVVAIDLKQAPLEKLKAQMETEDGATPGLLTLDCIDRAAVRSAFAQLEAERGGIDVLVNNIGRSAREFASFFADSDPEVWDLVINTSLQTTMNCTRAVAPGMRDRRSGKIVNISSEAALSSDPKLAEYAAAKAGILGFTRVVARELAPYGVNVNAVLPGITRTEAIDSIPADIVQAAEAAIPLGMMCEPEDIACAVTFLASPDARCIVGQSLMVNGGKVMH
jgi:acetoacetyl-CoA reductase/3-oxoacyl-[acyl-carrier protein] reductase